MADPHERGPGDAGRKVQDRLLPAIDRFQEAHFFLHAIENTYHFADPFRWQLNAFLRALKEIPQLIQMKLQSVRGFVRWYKDQRVELQQHPLMTMLHEQRDVIVHRDMLSPRSTAAIGVTDGRGLRAGIGLPVDPFTDSDEAMRRFVVGIASTGDFLGILDEDEDTIPCVQRGWYIGGLADDVVAVSFTALSLTEQLLRSSAERVGVHLPDRLPTCTASSHQYQIRTYERGDLRMGRVVGRPM